MILASAKQQNYTFAYDFVQISKADELGTFL